MGERRRRRATNRRRKLERERERERDDVEVRAFALIYQAARFERFLVGLVDVVVVVVVLEQNVPREGTTTFITFITTPAFVDCEGLELQQTFPAAAAPAAAERFLREPNGRGQALPLD